VLDSLRGELTSILSDVGVRFEWKWLADARGDESFAALAVVTFKGRCDLNDLIPEYVENGPLGWTHSSGGEVLPFSDVNCDRIRGFLSRRLIHLWPQERTQAFGRAMARVLAHELYHAFTHTDHHGSSGVAQPSYNVEELMADDFWFAEADQRALTAALKDSSGSDFTAGLAPAGESVFARSGCVRCHGPQGDGTRRAPSLRAPGRPLETGDLAARLAGKASEMYRRARGLGMLWRPVAGADIEYLVTYLNTALE
jgi:mono/diheme cytochrome c family protein